jgi:hypothetical protein
VNGLLRAAAVITGPLLHVCAATTALPAQTHAFVREYTYRASDADSKHSAREMALVQVKRLLMEEVAAYLESTLASETAEKSVDGRPVVIHAQHQQGLRTLAAGITQTRIVDEKWDGKEYWLRAEILVNRDEVRRRLVQLAEEVRVSSVPAVVTAPVPTQPPSGHVRGATSTRVLPEPIPDSQRPGSRSAHSISDWEVAIEACTTVGPYLECELTFASRGNELRMRLNTCDPDEHPESLSYCSRTYFGGGLVLPLGFVSSTLPVNSEMSPSPGITVLSDKRTTIVTRAENPPQGATHAREIVLRMTHKTVGVAGSRTNELRFVNVPIIAKHEGSSTRSGTSAASHAVRYELIECVRVVGGVECAVRVRNDGPERSLMPMEVSEGRTPVDGTSRAFDENRNVYPLGRFQFGSRTLASTRSSSKVIPAGDEVILRFRVPVDSAVRQLSRIELRGRLSPDQKEVKVVFTAIEIGKSSAIRP